ncbi:MAG: ABC transporter ATP-binding protein [Gemmatimonadota bacterium]
MKKPEPDTGIRSQGSAGPAATSRGGEATAAVRTENLWKVFEHDHIRVEAVRGVTFRIDPGEFVVLSGPSGSGKTTLLNLIGGLTRPSDGRVWVEGREIGDLPDRELAEIRLERVGFVFQAYNLLPVLTALENAEFTLLLRGVGSDERIGIAGLENRMPGKLSGGQQQRVAVARAVVGHPAIVLADEPTANLDTATSASLIDLMAELNLDLDTTFVFATHDPLLIERARRNVRLVDGAIVADERQD